MVAEGLFERFPCDMVFGAHNDPTLKLGTMMAVAGPVCANTDDFTIRVRGAGGHAAHPETALDPVVIGAQIVLALQTLVSRRVRPGEAAAVSVCQFHAGSATNVIPDDAVLNGTIRTLQPDTRAAMVQWLQDAATGIARANGAEAEVEIEPGYPGIINAAEPTARAARAATALLGEGRVIRDQAPSLGGEDFAYMAQAVPGCFVRIGMADGERGSAGLHTVRYDFNDDALPIGASFWAALVEQELPRDP